MLEWYRAGEPYQRLIEDCMGLLARTVAAAGSRDLRFGGHVADPFEEPEILSVAEAFDRYADIDLLATLRRTRGREREALAAGARRNGITIAADDSWRDIFSKIIAAKIEPQLGHGRPAILMDYPASEAALAKLQQDPRFAERFELYACGVELANGFGELTDAPVFSAAVLRRPWRNGLRIYGEAYPIDEDFLQAFAIMPQACGIALGFDRLVMLATGASHIEQVIWTPVQKGMSGAMRDPPALLRSAADLVERRSFAGLPKEAVERIAAAYAIGVTGAVAELIDRADPHDPIARQFVPDLAELAERPGEMADPTGDLLFSPSKALSTATPIARC